MKIKKSVINRQTGFTLIELMVAISIITLLASILLVIVANARVKARDTTRKQTLLQLAKALELYYSDNGSYPSTVYSGGVQGNYEKGWCVVQQEFCTYSGPNGYIPNLAPQYIGQLPSDPLVGQPLGGAPPGYSGYYYFSDGKDYKVKAAYTNEEAVFPADQNDPFHDPAGRWSSYVVYTPGGASW